MSNVLKHCCILVLGGLLLLPGRYLCAQSSSDLDLDELIVGAVDVHVHSAPDVVARSIDDFDVVRLSEKKGLSAIVIKNHSSSTAARAELMNVVAKTVRVYGGVALNYAVGGINPSAVEAMHQMSEKWGKVVWFPTRDAAHHLKTMGKAGEGLTVLQEGQLSEAAQQVLQLIADHDLVLATGHLSPQEVRALVQEAHNLGITKILITHPMAEVPNMHIDQLKELAQLGALLELTYLSHLYGPNAPLPSLQSDHQISFKQTAAAIKGIGAEHFVLSSDLGQVGNALPADGLRLFAQGLIEQGITVSELEIMLKVNPQRLLGISE